MPIYEYLCTPCGRVVSLLIRKYDEADQGMATCPSCGKTDLQRLISAPSISRGKNSISEPRKSPNDPHLLAQNMRSSMRRSGQDYGTEFKEVAHRLEKGESANSIEKSLRKRSGEKPHMCPDGHVH
ncbi:MAG: FmdB family zinc ribbon protein [Candidatus Neomarinimicrobiota bacterium]|nr:FmdB family zinc ribbon protein [Candidatus Neomarinimicrobiota bacterium]